MSAQTAAPNPKSTACPRFHGCSANLCPLDPDWRLRSHLRGEPVCGMALEAVKDGSEARFEVRGWGELYSKVVAAIPELMSRGATLRYAILRAPEYGSNLDRVAPNRTSDVHAEVSQ